MEEARQRIIKQEIPKGAIMMSRYEAIAHQSSFVYTWKNQNEVWPLVHGTGILSLAASLGGAYVNFIFRRKLKVHNIGILPSMMAITGPSFLLTTLSRSLAIDNKLLLLELPCPLCLELRGAIIQAAFGYFTPFITVPIITFIVVGSRAYNIPYPNEGRKILTIAGSVYQHLIPKLSSTLILQAMIGGFITYLQIKSYLRILDITYLLEHEKKPKRGYIQQ
ncbi:PREDICTED: uncharacterized protein LOC106741983 [Dinoponera quadriceps]|uniref:Uncharacterized protein LOC106741983 n=1 Tax=Dinoponera quadriceps TaxID=609295 RepID=A0A6P3WVQ8_DINQU|nr:PREDICTED: uncharacterized protein LOC106741983 [Dinoponera quadriceps]